MVSNSAAVHKTSFLKHHAPHLLLAVALLAAPLAALSKDTPWYKVEVLIFENLDRAATGAESWPNDPGTPNTLNAMELVPAGAATTTGGIPNQFPAVGAPPLPTGVKAPSGPLAVPEGAVPAGAKPGAAVNEQPFVILAANSMDLATAATRLIQSGKFKVLAHVAWRQPIEKGAEPRRLHFFKGMSDANVYFEVLQARQQLTSNPISGEAPVESPLSASLTSTSPDGQSSAMDASTSPFFRTPLDGTIGIRLSRYLHLEADLVLSRLEALPAGAIATGGTQTRDDFISITQNGQPSENSTSGIPAGMALRGYRLTTTRRMRSKEIHYIDHPAFGILAGITPYDAAAVKEQQLEDAADTVQPEE